MQAWTRFNKLIDKIRFGIVTTHDYPDADGIGSELALTIALRRLKKNVLCVNEEELPERYDHLNAKDMILSVEQYKRLHKERPIDLLIVADAHSPDRLGTQMQKIAHNVREVVYIDHHPCPSHLKKNHFIDTSCAATGELVGNLIEKMGLPLDEEIALPLYTSILIDTNSFRYPSVTGETHRLTAKLIDSGVRPHLAYNAIYGAKKISHIKLLGSLLSSIEVSKDNSLAWISLREKDLRDYEVGNEETLAFINNLLILDKIKIGCMFREKGREVKVSLRSLTNVNVGHIASVLGGGGHPHSAAVILKGSLEEVIEIVTNKIIKLLKDDPDVHIPMSNRFQS